MKSCQSSSLSAPQRLSGAGAVRENSKGIANALDGGRFSTANVQAAELSLCRGQQWDKEQSDLAIPSVNGTFLDFFSGGLSSYLFYIACWLLPQRTQYSFFFLYSLLFPTAYTMTKSKREPSSRRRSMSDPLAAALLPPPNESPIERELRLKRETEARKTSENIDEMIRQERIQKKRTKADVKVLLLGQSESGKSTTLKQFQLVYAQAAFRAERMAWRTVIYLNLVRSIMRILEALSPEADNVDDHDDGDELETALVIISSSGRPPSALSGTRVPNYESYCARLAPLVDLEDRLTRLLSSPEEDEPTRLPPSPHYDTNGFSNGNRGAYRALGPANGARPAPTISIPQQRSFSASPISPVNGQALAAASGSRSSPSTSNGISRGKEVSVHASVPWKKGFTFGGKSKSPKTPNSGEIEGWWENPDDPVHTLHACSSAMQELWRDPKVRQRLKEKRIRLEESSGFYLDDISRITAKKYFPTDVDVLKARLKTTGVVEHTFTIPSGNDQAEWRIYDVGGARNQRQAWAPYFQDVTAIIFLAPISAFDQVLTEDPRVNRLEDSLLLWRSVVSNKLLANVSLVLFLNKIDLLQAKLEAGVRLSHHMINYGSRPNDYETVSNYFRTKFGALHQTHTPNKERECYIHLTAVTDTRRTAMIISTVRDIIIKVNLRNMKLV
ncbi:putative G protein alpha subunit [Lyophyllum shimeji]|uniref:G protein alpha subunit n=1 Tax=Lyophyllum shimeji TaxID=47721 RepID=A0A9P3PX24_LYOSH|nr:putative G protein alpha subunit [Lyophyllum shimeji]